MALIAIALLLLPFALSAVGQTWVRVINLALLYVMLALGLNIVVGFAGLLDLGYIAFYAVGAYVYALLASPHFGLHLPFWIALPIGFVVAALFGALLGAPTLKLRGDYLAIVTLGFGEIIRIFLNNLNAPVNITNGPQGINLIDPLRIGDFSFAKSELIAGVMLTGPMKYYYPLMLLTLLIAGSGVLFVMLLLLQLSTGSFKAAALVMINLPLSIIGGIAAVFLTQTSHPFESALALFGIGSGLYQPPVVSIASMVGFITLFGIAVRNGILLVNHYQHIVSHEGKPLEDAIIQGSMERLVPILMTALCAALGLLPLALAMGKPGSELLAPLAVVVLGGLISSTFLNLMVVPAAYSLFFGVKRAAPARTAGPLARLIRLKSR